jgi:STE24 endopeptidase
MGNPLHGAIVRLMLAGALLLPTASGIAADAPAAADTASEAAKAIRPVDDAWRAALPLDPVQATQAYLDRIPAAARERSDAYFEGGYWLQLWNLLLGLAVAWWLLATRPAKAVRAWCLGEQRATPRRPVTQALLYGAFFVLASWLLTLPLTIWQGFVREHAYGMATQSFGPWFGEQLLALAITLAVGAPLIAALYAVIRRAPRFWWVGGTLLVMVFTVVSVVLGPVYIEPLFNTYKPLEEGPLREQILSMARANGVPVTNVYEFDASRQTTRVSANVSGLFGTAAVRMNDNLLRRSSEPEIRAVVGHEIGHYAMNHISKGLLQVGVLIVIGFAFVAWALRALLARHGKRWGVQDVASPGSLPLLVALFSLYLFLITPINNTMIRTEEIEADLYGLNLAREPHGEAEVLLKLVEYRKADPGPIEEFVFFDHPSTRTRIFNAMRWRAELGIKPAPQSTP